LFDIVLVVFTVFLFKRNLQDFKSCRLKYQCYLLVPKR
jgi:hypothetical protein